MKTKLIPLLTALCLAVTAAGCSSSGAQTAASSDGSETAAAETAAAETAEAETAAAETPEAESGAAVEDAVTFETTDLDGNPVSSADIFSQHKMTMVNLWGTYCGPCIGEMPDLEILNARLAEKDCAIIGVVIDVRSAGDTAMISTAKEILTDTGVTYLNLVPWATLWDDLPAEFIPTTYFIDSNGAVVGEAAIGARGADEYEALVDALL